MKKVLAIILSLAMAFALAACGGTTSSDTASQTEKAETAAAETVTAAAPAQAAEEAVEYLAYGLRNNSWDLSPWMNNGSSGNTVYTLLYAGLMCCPGFGTAFEDCQLDMAESIEYSDDNLKATVKLKDYIVDSKGNKITAEDVVFSYTKAPEVAGTHAAINTYMKSIKAVDDYTVEIELNNAVAGAWLYVLCNNQVISKSWYESASDDEKSNDPACTGAYCVKENISGTSVTFEALDDFWQKDEDRTVYEIVNVKEITCEAISEDTMRCVALENGELDIAWIENASINLFEGDDNYNLFSFYMPNVTTIVFNCSEESPFYDNANLRLACLHAIDFEQVLYATASGFGFQGHDMAPASCYDYQKSWDDEGYYDYDVELAKEYLEKAGYKEGELEIHFMCKTMAAQKAGVVVIQDCLAKIGINVVIDAYDQALFDTYTTDPTQWDMSWQSGNLVTGSVTEAWNFYCGQKSDEGTLGFVKDDKLQELLDEAMLKDDEESLNAFHEYLLETGYAVNAFNEQAYFVAEKGITGVQFNIMENAALNACTFSPEFEPAK